MTTLRTFANLWTLWDHPGTGAQEWPLKQKIAAVAEAGFDGVMGEPGQGIGALAEASGLRFIAFSRLNVEHDFVGVLSRCRDEGAVVLQVHLGWHDTDADTALRLALKLEDAAGKVGLEAVMETHRDTCTETPEKAAALRVVSGKRPREAISRCCWTSRTTPSSSTSPHRSPGAC